MTAWGAGRCRDALLAELELFEISVPRAESTDMYRFDYSMWSVVMSSIGSLKDIEVKRRNEEFGTRNSKL